MFKRINFKFVVLAMLAICVLSLGISPSVSKVRASELTDSQIKQIQKQAILEQAGVDEIVYLDNETSKKQFGEEMLKHSELKKYLNKEKISLNFDLKKTYGVKVKKQGVYYTTFALQDADGLKRVSGLYNHSTNQISRLGMVTVNLDKKEMIVKDEKGVVSTYTPGAINKIKMDNKEGIAKKASEISQQAGPKKYSWQWFLANVVCDAAGSASCFGLCATAWATGPVIVTACTIACEIGWSQGICQI
ncbi:hypothetical protein J2Z48_003058 [Croceifilum oryzae]|uniref:Uncharacterized protein n=1 Tax=Croceifilum oryzae TaxID=1553429 RepID=A0AAJ1WTW5_9BACL|nr:hypothetical protein [Croceifilum oryzae]MDQ0418853.1 hypothetical protein [Croceifilum oryzae]